MSWHSIAYNDVISDLLQISILTHIKSEFSKILIAVDGSQSSMNAAIVLIALAKKEKNSDSPQILSIIVDEFE